MDSYFKQSIRPIFWMTIWAIIGLILVWFLLPAYRLMAAGLLLGTVFSLANGWILAVKTMHTGEAALHQQRRIRGVGMTQRLLLSILAVYIGLKFPDYFHYLGIIIGLLTVTVFSFIHAVLQHSREAKATSERGEN